MDGTHVFHVPPHHVRALVLHALIGAPGGRAKRSVIILKSVIRERRAQDEEMTNWYIERPRHWSAVAEKAEGQRTQRRRAAGRARGVMKDGVMERVY